VAAREAIGKCRTRPEFLGLFELNRNRRSKNLVQSRESRVMITGENVLQMHTSANDTFPRFEEIDPFLYDDR
jgi:hypothetical protein